MQAKKTAAGLGGMFIWSKRGQNLSEMDVMTFKRIKKVIGPLQDPVSWYGINYDGTQITKWDFQYKGKSSWASKSSFVLEVPLCYLRPSVIYSVPCDRILQKAYLGPFAGCLS